MRLRHLGALAALGLTGALLLAVSSAGAAAGDAPTRTYIVQLQLEPVLTYEGGVAGIPATAPEQMPSVVEKESEKPRAIAFLVTSAMSAPGVIVSSAASPINASRFASIVSA